MTRKLLNLLLSVFLLTLWNACTDPITLDLEPGKAQLVVDGFITDRPGTQLIKLRLTSGYLDNSPSPPALHAEVKVTDGLGRVFTFTDVQNNGNYTWSPAPNDTLPMGFAGNFYVLHIKYNNEEFEAAAMMDPAPAIDSIGFEFNKEFIQGEDTIPAGYTAAKMYTLNQVSGSYEETRDVAGMDNCYWFKSYKNGSYFNRPGQINLAYDAAYGPGSDGIVFIPPIVFSLTPERLKEGDTLDVECWSVGLATYYFIALAQQQMNNGGLFATPPANVPSNIVNKNKEGSQALGWFGAAGVTAVREVAK